MKSRRSCKVLTRRVFNFKIILQMIPLPRFISHAERLVLDILHF